MATRTPSVLLARRVGLLAGLLVTLQAGCSSAPPPPPPPPPETPPPAGSTLVVEPVSAGISGDPSLMTRMAKSPHAYFRFINVPFSDLVCARTAESMGDMPSVNLHGDAHLEQYSVTDHGHGLTDFDDSSVGPAAIDLLRLSVSIHLAAFERGFPDETADALIDDLFTAYRSALDNPDVLAVEPELAKRFRREFKRTPAGYISESEALMISVDKALEHDFKTALGKYGALELGHHPDLPKTFFHPKRVGRLEMGIGSALTVKYLFRVEGQTAAPDDDMILEAKQVRDLTGIRCVRTGGPKDPFRIIVGKSRLETEPHPYLGYIRVGDDTFWVHTWEVNYRELTIGELVSPDELAEVVREIGTQLGRGHPKQIAAPLDEQLRVALVSTLERHHDDLHVLARDLASETLDAWQSYKLDARVRAASGER